MAITLLYHSSQSTVLIEYYLSTKKCNFDQQIYNRKLSNFRAQLDNIFIKFVAIKIAVLSVRDSKKLSSETVQGAPLPFQCVYNIHGSDGLSLSMLGVGYSITDNIFKEHF